MKVIRSFLQLESVTLRTSQDCTVANKLTGLQQRHDSLFTSIFDPQLEERIFQNLHSSSPFMQEMIIRSNCITIPKILTRPPRQTIRKEGRTSAANVVLLTYIVFCMCCRFKHDLADKLFSYHSFDTYLVVHRTPSCYNTKQERIFFTLFVTLRQLCTLRFNLNRVGKGVEVKMLNESVINIIMYLIYSEN